MTRTEDMEPFYALVTRPTGDDFIGSGGDSSGQMAATSPFCDHPQRPVDKNLNAGRTNGVG